MSEDTRELTKADFGRAISAKQRRCRSPVASIRWLLSRRVKER